MKHPDLRMISWMKHPDIHIAKNKQGEKISAEVHNRRIKNQPGLVPGIEIEDALQ